MSDERIPKPIEIQILEVLKEIHIALKELRMSIEVLRASLT